MYNGVNLVTFPDTIDKVTRVAPSVVPIQIDAPSIEGVTFLEGSPKGSPEKYIREYVIKREEFSLINRVGFELIEDFETGANIFNIKNMQRATEVKFDGQCSMRSIPIGHSKSTVGTMTFNLLEPMVLTFKYVVSSESGYDKFTGKLDGKQIFSISGSPSWATFTATLQAGEHTLTFTYSKDSSASRGYDGGFIDAIKLTPLSSDAKSLVKIDGKYYRKDMEWTEVTASTEYAMLNDFGMTSLNAVTDADAFIQGKDFSVVTLTSNVSNLAVAGRRRLTYSYRITVGDNPLTAWSNTRTTPTSETIRVFSSDMQGADTKALKVEYKIGIEDYSEATDIKIDNEAPTIDLEESGLTFTAIIEDSHGDTVKCKVYMNGEQVFPIQGEPVFEPTPYVYTRTFLSNQVVPGTMNELTIEVEDLYGGKTTLKHKFFARYVGLMFHDEDHKYYSTDLGEVLKLLLLEPAIMAGAATLPSKVYVTNEYSFPVKNVKLYADNPIENTSVVFSKEGDPFTAVDVIDMGEHVYNVNEGFYFYVRVTSHHNALQGGQFQIVVEAMGVD